MLRLYERKVPCKMKEQIIRLFEGVEMWKIVGTGLCKNEIQWCIKFHSQLVPQKSA